MARKAEYSIEQIIEALELSRGLLTHAAKRLGCHPSTLHSYAARHPTVADTLKWEREKILDIGESKLFEKVDAGDLNAITLLLKNLGKDRGYVERSESKVDASVGIVDVQGVPSAARGRE